MYRSPSSSYLGVWNTFIGDFSRHVRDELLRDSTQAQDGGSTPRQKSMITRELPTRWIDRDGVCWDLSQKRVALETPYFAPRDTGIWWLHDIDSPQEQALAFEIDRAAMRALEADGLQFSPAALLSERTFAFVAAADLREATSERADQRRIYAPFRILRGSFWSFYPEGGWEAESVAIPVNPSHEGNRVIDAEAVRLAIGVGLRKLPLQDGTVSWCEVTVEGDLTRGFDISLDAVADIPSMQWPDRMKTLKLSWDPADGDPFARVCEFFAGHEFGPGSDSWEY